MVGVGVWASNNRCLLVQSLMYPHQVLLAGIVGCGLQRTVHAFGIYDHTPI